MEPHGNVSGTFSVQSRSLRRMHSIFNLYWTIHCFCAMGVASTTAGTRTIDSYTLRSRMDIRSSVVDPSGARQWDERYFKSDDYGFNLVRLPTSVQWDKPKTGDIQLWRGPGKMGGVPPGREAGRGRKNNGQHFPLWETQKNCTAFPLATPRKNCIAFPLGDTQNKLHSIPPWGTPRKIAQHFPLGDTQKKCTASLPAGQEINSSSSLGLSTAGGRGANTIGISRSPSQVGVLVDRPRKGRSTAHPDLRRRGAISAGFCLFAATNTIGINRSPPGRQNMTAIIPEGRSAAILHDQRDE